MQAAYALRGKASWEEIERWLQSRHGRLPMLIVFENSEDALMVKESAKVWLPSSGVYPCHDAL